MTWFEDTGNPRERRYERIDPWCGASLLLQVSCPDNGVLQVRNADDYKEHAVLKSNNELSLGKKFWGWGRKGKTI